MTTTTHVDETAKVSPKVIAGLLVGFAIAAIGGIIAAVTPDTFSFLGAWGPIIYSVVTVGGAQLAAYLKGDPLRTNTTVAAATAPPVVTTSADAPVANPTTPVDISLDAPAGDVTTADQVAGH